VKKVNKAVLALSVVLITLLSLVPFVAAAPLQTKNNDKFDNFGVVFVCNSLTWISQNVQATPSFDQAKLVILSGSESFIAYDITIGSHTYHLGTDFIYTGHFNFIYYDVTEWNHYMTYTWPATYRTEHTIVDYSYTFLPASGIEGTIQMRAEGVGGYYGMTINSLAGTGDLQNVQIKATSTSEVVNNPIWTVTHAGLVSGWPQ
jgi:hypothetical protein